MFLPVCDEQRAQFLSTSCNERNSTCFAGEKSVHNELGPGGPHPRVTCTGENSRLDEEVMKTFLLQ